jgi:hypothetical protein
MGLNSQKSTFLVPGKAQNTANWMPSSNLNLPPTLFFYTFVQIAHEIACETSSLWKQTERVPNLIVV